MPRKKQVAEEKPTDVEPLRASECQAIIAGLESGALDHRAIHERIVAAVRNGRLWSTKEWKALRSQLIKAACEQCGETAGPMNLQHLWHPETVTDIARQIRATHREEHFVLFVAECGNDPRFQNRIVPDGPPRPGCPKCGGWVLRERKSKGMKRFHCASQRRRRRCQFEFDEAVEIQPLTVEDGLYRLKTAFAEAYEPIYQEISEAVLRFATIHAVSQFQQYMSGEGTATFCRRCAYMWDEKGLRLCVTCRDAWHDHFAKQCNACEKGRK